MAASTSGSTPETITATALHHYRGLNLAQPAPVDDPDNFGAKAAAMSACWAVFKSHGAECLVVSGALDSAALIDHVTNHIEDADWTIVRLRIAREERRDPEQVVDLFLRQTGWPALPSSDATH